MHLAAHATPSALFSVCLMDEACPPSTIYAAYHSYAGAAEIEVYPFNGHEGGGKHHRLRQVEWLMRLEVTV